MRSRRGRILLALWAASAGTMAFGFEEPGEVLERVLHRVRGDLARLPNYVCTQTIQRFSRAGADEPWRKSDTLRFDVAVVGSQELYARPGDRRFETRPLAEVVGRGTIGTGQFGNLARLVFALDAAHFTYKGLGQRYGRPVHEWEYDVPLEKSGYRLRSGPAESLVAFQGAFWVDARTLDLMRLEIQAYDIPDDLGLAQADSDVTYSRVLIDGTPALLPLNASLSVVAADGEEDLNRTQLDRCRRYSAESAVRFASVGDGAFEADRIHPSREVEIAQPDIPIGSMLEFALDAPVDPERAAVGDEVRIVLLRPPAPGDIPAIPAGTRGTLRLVRLDRHAQPFPVYDFGFEFESLELGGRVVPVAATMQEAGPAPGLIKQSKTLDPTFTKRRSARMNILVREVQPGQGILNWDGRKGPLPRGLKMRWRVDPAAR
jgi:hypothetical protein